MLVGSSVSCGDFVRGFRSLRRSFAYYSESPSVSLSQVSLSQVSLSQVSVSQNFSDHFVICSKHTHRQPCGVLVSAVLRACSRVPPGAQGIPVRLERGRGTAVQVDSRVSADIKQITEVEL